MTAIRGQEYPISAQDTQDPTNGLLLELSTNQFDSRA